MRLRTRWRFSEEHIRVIRPIAGLKYFYTLFHSIIQGTVKHKREVKVFSVCLTPLHFWKSTNSVRKQGNSKFSFVKGSKKQLVTFFQLYHRMRNSQKPLDIFGVTYIYKNESDHILTILWVTMSQMFRKMAQLFFYHRKWRTSKF